MGRPSLNVHDLHALLLLFLSWLLLAQPTLGANSTTNTTANVLAVTKASFFAVKPGCKSTCGHLFVPYPFGIGVGCYLDSYFEINCSSSSFNSRPQPFLGATGFKVLDILQNQIRVANVISSACYNSVGNVTQHFYDIPVPMAWPYTVSSTANKFTVVGCDDFGWITGTTVTGTNLTGGCAANCDKITDLKNGSCSGIGCCQIDIPPGLKSLGTALGSINDHKEVLSFNPCSYAFVAEQDKFYFHASDISNSTSFEERITDGVPLVGDFVVGNRSTCAEAQNSRSSLCAGNTTCADNQDNVGYLCSCKHGYMGNPYLGCTDIDECYPSKYSYLNVSSNSLNNCDENANCINTLGSYRCSCKHHYHGDGINCSPKDFLSLGLGFGFSSFLIIVIWLYFGTRRRKQVKQRETFFKRNGGLLMKQKISSIDVTNVGMSKFFTAEELRKATNNYAEDRILGQGGYGVVYKGILLDQRVVAIKKSKVMDVSQVEQFINELFILTQVNHKNVVKVLGCCFESEVPELVYEYIPNGTLYQHIHRTMPWLTLDHRLRIAIEAASALSYLHSDTSIPIIHRDVKSANILVDANYVAKMADFGASRLVPLDQTQASTLVQGTLGYLDPEYLQSSQLTEKSDVYSFGVVLAELFTGKKVICPERSEGERNLATYFIVSMKENKLSQILDPPVVREGTLEQLQAIAELVKRCLVLKSEERPAMKEVVLELERLRKFEKDPLVSQQSHEERVSLPSEEAHIDSYTESISPSTNALHVPMQYTLNCSMSFPLTKSLPLHPNGGSTHLHPWLSSTSATF